MTQYFGRVYKLDFSDANGNVLRSFDGFPTTSHQPLQIEFVIDQTPAAERSYADITIYGVSRETREQIYEQFTRVTLQAGYGGAYGTIFDGELYNATNGRKGPDSFVKIFASTGSSIWRSVQVSKTLGEKATAKEVIRTVAETFGYPVEFIGDFSALPRALKGRVLDGDSKRYMRELSRAHEFSWFLENGTMLIVKDGAERPDARPFAYKPTTGLIGTPQITDQGVDIEVLLNPSIRPWDVYTVESQTQEISFSGVYWQNRQFPKTAGVSRNTVLRLEHEGDFYGDRWQTKLTGRIPGGIAGA